MRNQLLLASILAVSIAGFGAGCKSSGHDHAGHDHAGHNHSDHDDDSKEEVITAKDVPAAVQRGFDKAYPNVTVKKIEKETYKDGTVHYEFEFVTAAGKEGEAELDDAGEVLPDH